MVNDFILMTDDFCDMPLDWYKKNDIPVVTVCYTIDGTTYRRGDITEKEFYALIRAGKLPTTAAGNVEDIKAIMEPHLKDGKDVLYLAFSSGLSGTYQSGEIAASELGEIYSDRKIIVIDTLCASLGEGLFVYHAKKLKDAGMSIDELSDWARKNRLNVAHYVMADDLKHLHRGGRVSKASAIAGTMLGIKPIIHMNNEGKLIPVDKIRGKKQALTDIVDKLQKAVGKTKNDFFTVCHADCLEDAQYVAELISKRYGIKDYIINYIGPVIGSHTGAGTVAVFMMAEHR